MADALPAFTPVNLLTGFLGAGKTTLLQRLLDDPALADTAVLINEFGEVGLDHHLLERIDETTVLLQSGCLCCTIRGELADAMRGLHEKRERGRVAPFRRLVIESTGLADPFPILTTLHADPVLRHHYRPGNVVCAVDAAVGALHLARAEAVKQVAAADRIVLTKTDLAAAEEAGRVLGMVRAINPAAPVVLASAPAPAPRQVGSAQRGESSDGENGGPTARDLMQIASYKRELPSAPEKTVDKAPVAKPQAVKIAAVPAKAPAKPAPVTKAKADPAAKATAKLAATAGAKVEPKAKPLATIAKPKDVKARQ